MRISEIYSKINQIDSAFFYYKKYKIISDTLQSIQTNKEANNLLVKYDTEKKDAQIKQANLEFKLQEERSKKKSTIIVICIIALCITLFTSILAYVNYRKAKKTNKLIELKNISLDLQKKIVEQKQADILSSIHYAKRIQQSLLPTEKYINRIINKK